MPLHPSIESRIIDNSVVFVTADPGTALFAAFRADKGIDNKVVRVSSPSEFVYNYGNLNFRKYGQAPHNVINWLGAGGDCYCMRILPYAVAVAAGVTAPAVYSAVKLVVGVRPAFNAAGEALGTFEFQTRIAPISSTPTEAATKNRTRKSIKSALKTDSVGVIAKPANITGTDKTNTMAYVDFDIVAFVAKSRGSYSAGNLKVDIQLASNDDATYDYRTYDLTVYTEGGSVEGTYRVSLYPEAINMNNGMSLFIADVVNRYSSTLEVIFNDSGYTQLSKVLATAVNGVADLTSKTLDFKQIDFITGMNRDATGVIDEVSVKTTEMMTRKPVISEALSTKIADIVLTQGSDGVFAAAADSEKTYYDTLLLDLYSGTAASSATDETDFSAVADKANYQFDVILDAAHSKAVKAAMSSMAEKRGDCITILDLGLGHTSASAAKTERTTNVTVNTYFTSIFAQDWMVKDSSSGKDINVSSTYFLASKIPMNDKANRGMHIPFVGPRRGSISGFSSCSWFPSEPEKEDLYKAKINYVEKTPKDVRFMSQLTSQAVNSALSDIPHVRVLLRIRRDVETLVGDWQFEPNNGNSLDQINYSLNQYLAQYATNGACSSIGGSVYASEYDKQSRLVRVLVSLTFTNFIERFSIDFVVNK